MQKSNSAFTMIELIFVIIILGLLAAVAVPKLAATRADAEASAKANAVVIAASEIASYAVAVGSTESNLSDMSNSIAGYENSGEVYTEVDKAVFNVGLISECVTIEITRDSGTDTLKILFGNSNGDSACGSVQSLINQDEYPMKLTGISVIN